MLLGLSVASGTLLRSPVAALATKGSGVLSSSALDKMIKTLEVTNPGFTKESCVTMFSTKLRLGGPVPPADYVKGCNEVCDSIKSIGGLARWRRTLAHMSKTLA